MTDAKSEWARCRPWIVKAVKYTAGMYEIGDVEKAIEDGTMIFIPGKYSAVVLEVASYPNGKALNVFLGGGENGKAIDEYLTKMDACIVALAKSSDCRWITHYTRASGERIGERIGYRKQWTVMIKEVGA